MANDWDTTARNVALDAVTALCTRIALHTADPGAANLSANEVAGGSPAYARKAIAFAAAAAGSTTPTADVVLDVPATTVSWVSGWNTAGTVRYFKKDVLDEVFAAQGTYTMKATTTFDWNDP